MAIKINLMPQRENGAAAGKPPRPFYFFIAAVFFIASFLIYSGIYSYNAFFLKKQLNIIEKQNTDIQENISKTATAEELSTVVAAVTKGESIRSILSGHLYASKIYELLENLTIKTVLYDKFSEKINNDNTISVSISGETDSFSALAKQLMIFKKSKEIKEIIFKEAAVGKNGKVLFSIVLSIDLKTITVRPVITLSGLNPVEATAGSDYSDAGASAIDGVDGYLAVATTGSVDTNIIGTYILTYTAVNTAGNSATAIRTVNVAAR